MNFSYIIIIILFKNNKKLTIRSSSKIIKDLKANRTICS